MEAALARLWRYPLLEGCYLDKHTEPHAQAKYEPSLALAEHGHLYGLAHLPDGNRVACGSFTHRRDDGIDWLGFYLPGGALSEVYSAFRHPLDLSELSRYKWENKINDWLADLGTYIFEEVPFQLGLVGHEVLAETNARSLAKQGIPDERYMGYLRAQDGKLQYFPMNK